MRSKIALLLFSFCFFACSVEPEDLAKTESAVVVTANCGTNPWVTSINTDTPPSSGVLLWEQNGSTCKSLANGDSNVVSDGSGFVFFAVANGYHAWACHGGLINTSGTYQYVPCEDGQTRRFDGPVWSWGDGTVWFAADTGTTWLPRAPLCGISFPLTVTAKTDCHATSNSGLPVYQITLSNGQNLTHTFPGGDSGGPCTIDLGGVPAGVVEAQNHCPTLNATEHTTTFNY